jgi:diguanylate cyclase (GGDEF)-like protein
MNAEPLARDSSESRATSRVFFDSLSRSDPLTGLRDRDQLDEDLVREVEQASLTGRPLTLLLIDIDHFEQVNHTVGAVLGDAVLVEVAALLRGHIRAGDVVYRFGGDEFAVMARQTDVAGGRRAADRLRQAVVAQYGAKTDGEVSVTISVGLAAISPETATAADLVASAAAALDAAKRAGRNRVRVSTTKAMPASAEPVPARG